MLCVVCGASKVFTDSRFRSAVFRLTLQLIAAVVLAPSALDPALPWPLLALLSHLCTPTTHSPPLHPAQWQPEFLIEFESIASPSGSEAERLSDGKRRAGMHKVWSCVLDGLFPHKPASATAPASAASAPSNAATAVACPCPGCVQHLCVLLALAHDALAQPFDARKCYAELLATTDSSSSSASAPSTICLLLPRHKFGALQKLHTKHQHKTQPPRTRAAAATTSSTAMDAVSSSAERTATLLDVVFERLARFELPATL